MRLTTILGLLLPCLLCGCAIKSDPAERAAADKVIAELRKGDVAAMQASVSPELRTPALADTMRRVSAMFPAAQPRSVRQIGYRWASNPEASDFEFTDEYAYPDKTLVVVIALHRPAGGAEVTTGFHVTPYSTAQIAAMGFGLANKSPWHYLFLAAMVLSPLSLWSPSSERPA